MSDLDIPTTDCTLHVQLRHIAVGLLRCRYAYRRVSVRASSTSRMGIAKFELCTQSNCVRICVQYVRSSRRNHLRMGYLFIRHRRI